MEWAGRLYGRGEETGKLDNYNSKINEIQLLLLFLKKGQQLASS